VLTPWGIVLAGLMSFWSRRRVLYPAGAAVAMAAGFETLLVVALDGYSFEVSWVVLGAACIGVIAALFRCPPCRRAPANGPGTQC
jgi:hypothetical protein